jgi:uncharacterized protein YndB with AHSA1/START domain
MAFPAEGADMDKQEIVARTEMLIRSPVAKVFEAFVEPAITSKFWFTRSRRLHRCAIRARGGARAWGGARHHDHMCRITNTIQVTMSAISSRE